MPFINIIFTRFNVFHKNVKQKKLRRRKIRNSEFLLLFCIEKKIKYQIFGKCERRRNLPGERESQLHFVLFHFSDAALLSRNKRWRKKNYKLFSARLLYVFFSHHHMMWYRVTRRMLLTYTIAEDWGRCVRYKLWIWTRAEWKFHFVNAFIFFLSSRIFLPFSLTVGIERSCKTATFEMIHNVNN